MALTFTKETRTLRKDNLVVEEYWEQEVFVAEGTGLGYWINPELSAAFVPTHLPTGTHLSGNENIITFYTEKQVQAYIEALTKSIDWNGDRNHLIAQSAWHKIHHLTRSVAYKARLAHPALHFAYTFIDDESGHHRIPIYRAPLADGRVICVRIEVFYESYNFDPEQWVEDIDGESVFIEGHYAEISNRCANCKRAISDGRYYEQGRAGVSDPMCEICEVQPAQIGA
jgi:hypothetical protein